jgi:hypothetical protein
VRPDHPELLARPMPRYTCYQTTAELTDAVSSDDLAQAFNAVADDTPVSLYLHIPYPRNGLMMQTLCWLPLSQGIGEICRVAGRVSHKLLRAVGEPIRPLIRFFGKAVQSKLARSRAGPAFERHERPAPRIFQPTGYLSYRYPRVSARNLQAIAHRTWLRMSRKVVFSCYGRRGIFFPLIRILPADTEVFATSPRCRSRRQSRAYCDFHRGPDRLIVARHLPNAIAIQWFCRAPCTVAWFHLASSRQRFNEIQDPQMNRD